MTVVRTGTLSENGSLTSIFTTHDNNLSSKLSVPGGEKIKGRLPPGHTVSFLEEKVILILLLLSFVLVSTKYYQYSILTFYVEIKTSSNSKPR